jgi:predicted acyltransferase
VFSGGFFTSKPEKAVVLFSRRNLPFELHYLLFGFIMQEYFSNWSLIQLRNIHVVEEQT